MITINFRISLEIISEDEILIKSICVCVLRRERKMFEITKHDVMYYGYNQVQILDSYPTFNLVEIKNLNNDEIKVVDKNSLTKDKSIEKSISIKIL